MLSKYSFRNFWLNVYIYKQNLVLNNQQNLICQKTKPTNQPTGVVAPDRVLSMGQIELNCVLMLYWSA